MQSFVNEFVTTVAPIQDLLIAIGQVVVSVIMVIIGFAMGRWEDWRRRKRERKDIEAVFFMELKRNYLLLDSVAEQRNQLNPGEKIVLAVEFVNMLQNSVYRCYEGKLHVLRPELATKLCYVYELQAVLRDLVAHADPKSTPESYIKILNLVETQWPVFASEAMKCFEFCHVDAQQLKAERQTMKAKAHELATRALREE